MVNTKKASGRNARERIKRRNSRRCSTSAWWLSLEVRLPLIKSFYLKYLCPSEKPTAETCKCNGKSVPSGKRYAGAGACDSDWRMSCGSFCFIEKGTCKDEVHLHGLEEYGFASCTPCSQRSNTAPLKEAECPSDTFTTHGNGSPILIGRGFGLIAAGIYRSLLLFWNNQF